MVRRGDDRTHDWLPLFVRTANLGRLGGGEASSPLTKLELVSPRLRQLQTNSVDKEGISRLRSWRNGRLCPVGELSIGSIK